MNQHGIDETLILCVGMAMLYKRHTVTTSDADTMQQYLNAGGMIQYYDFSLATWR